MANALITGGAGFIGSNLSTKLIQEGYTVYCIDNLLTGNPNNLNPLRDNPNFTLIEHDVTKPFTDISDRLPEINYIFHLASPASPNPNSEKSYMKLPIQTLLTNSIGTYNLLELAREKQAKFLYTSTSEIYGDPKVSPQPETYFGNVNPIGVRSVYDEAKRFGEALVFAYIRNFDLDARVIRIFNTYGPNMRKDDGRVISNFINQAIDQMPITIYGKGDQTRSFCFIDDMIEAISKAMFTKNTKGEVINLGNPDERSIKDIAELIKSLTGSPAQITNQPRPEDDPETRKPDITKAKKLLGWEPKIPLEEGLKKTIEYFRNA